MTDWYAIRKRFEGVAWRSRFWRKWGSVVYLHRAYGYSYRDLLGMYERSVAAYKPGKKNFLGFDDKDVSGMYQECAARRNDEAERYACVEGCCTVLWHNGRNIGGYGRAGCPCDDMAEPRDLKRGVLR